ncbi:hypothetical protein H4P12_16245 [Paracoccus sp. 11-3]|uniref:Uncharacterized protein n=1 Tax=Paracoccus amoyensis TaxID=2760093 RepID=A0A926GQS5_9RHOB|nr:hypothetical protein [Paracoccus amoyensis]MBC9248225.1 hypothetical protein [Paracoccus amoyensis]
MFGITHIRTMNEKPQPANTTDLAATLATVSLEDAKSVANRAVFRVLSNFWLGSSFLETNRGRVKPPYFLLHFLRLAIVNQTGVLVNGLQKTVEFVARPIPTYSMLDDYQRQNSLRALVSATGINSSSDAAGVCQTAEYSFTTDWELPEAGDEQGPTEETLQQRRIFREAALQDVSALKQGLDIWRQPLWADGVTPPVQPFLGGRYLPDAPGSDFFADWLKRVAEGGRQNWDLLRDVALIKDELWNEGGEALDAEIRRLRQHHAIEATANGETIEANPETGKLRLVPETELPDNVAAYVRRKIIGATEIFDGASDQLYGGLAQDLSMLRRMAEDVGASPVELFDACSAATRRLVVRIQTGECPSAEQDPLIADYRKRLRDAAADILGSDEETRMVLERRAAIIGNTSLIDNRDAIIEMTEAVLPVLDPHLAEVLPEDANAATDPAVAPEDRAVASYRLIGRLLRIKKALPVARDVATGFAIGNGALVGAVNYMQAIEFLATSPAIKTAIEAILRYLGL